jgi:hypothetical protein
VNWDIPYFNQGHGAIRMAPTTVVASQKIIPGLHNITVGASTVPVYREADFSLTSGSYYNGIQYVMTFTLTDPANNNAVVGTGSVMFDMPFAGDNSLYTAVTAGTTAPSEADCEILYNQYSGQYKQTLFQSQGVLTDGTKLQLTATYDLLSGTQPVPTDPSAGNEYLYNSLIALQIIS